MKKLINVLTGEEKTSEVAPLGPDDGSYLLPPEKEKRLIVTKPLAHPIVPLKINTKKFFLIICPRALATMREKMGSSFETTWFQTYAMELINS